MELEGIFAVYKPVGITSHDVVARVRKLTGVKRVGHGGTLDPLASGVLVIAVGRENTKKLNDYVKGEKEYIATIKLGEVSETDDSQGPIRRFAPQGKPIFEPTINNIERSIQKFIGIFPQMPPQFSALKVGGKAAYKSARAGKKVELQPRTVYIKDIELLSYEYPLLKIQVKTGPGVYIRALARDIGKKLGTGAYMASLERTRVGTFRKQTAIPFDKLIETISIS